MKCSVCGSAIPDGARYCSNCGVSLAAQFPPPPFSDGNEDDRTVLCHCVPPVAPPPYVRTAEPPSVRKRNVVPIVIASVLAVCVLILCAILIFSGPTANIKDIDPDEPTVTAKEIVAERSVSRTLRASYIADANARDERFRSFDWLVDDYVTDEQLEDLSSSQLRILRNAIFAIHGYRFSSRDMADYFSRFDWYIPVSSDVTASLSTIEKKNIERIKKFE
ncbi:MAG: YARHG domain-containing protein [Paramuribaculum sp.]|nr:YARHG domain-containing protein [Paramuribaculum sp.]